MSRNRYDEISQAIIGILREYNIMSKKDFEAIDEATGCVLYENLKAGVAEEFNIDDNEMDRIFDEVLQTLLQPEI
ncbi:MAG: hypothetical protein J6C33_07475 [Lachnospiraceae bacterium]|nr:hypothetical protein [Lachnospiraceae bacterium]